MNESKEAFSNGNEQTGYANPYLAYLGTGSAKQTADSLINLAQARDGKLVVDAHSQGTLLTYSAMQYIKEDLQNVLKDKKDTTFS